MRRLFIGGRTFELSEHDYLSAIINLVNGYYTLAEAYHNYHLSGFADWKGSFQISDDNQNETVKAIVGAIDDVKLSDVFISLEGHLQELKNVDTQIVNWLVEYVGLSSLQSKKDKARLGQRLRKIIANGPGGHPQGPVWAMHTDFQEFVGRSRKILAAISKDKRQADQRLQQLMESSTRS